MEQITVDKYILKETAEAIRLAANILESRKRETAADRQIEFAERLLKWVLVDNQNGTPPSWIPSPPKKD